MNSPSEWFDVLRFLLDVKQDRTHVRIPVSDDRGSEIGHLEPLTVRHLGDPALVETFVRWRNQNLSGYLDQRPVTVSGTEAWLRETVCSPLRLAFLIFHGEKLIGRCGFVKLTPTDQEADGLVRGERGGGMNFLFQAQVAGLDWIFRNIGSESVVARVLSDNELALHNCERMGYDLTPFATSDVYRRMSPAGDQLLDEGSAAERIPGVRLHSIRLSRAGFYGANAGLVSGRSG